MPYLSKEREIETNFDPKPIPNRNYDWEAYRKDWDLDEPIGYGSTKEEAIQSLKEQENE